MAARAEAARKNNDTPAAIQLYSDALRFNPQWPSGWWQLGLLQYSSGAFVAARDAFTRYINLMPQGASSAQAVALRGICEIQTGDFLQSLADLQRALALGASTDPDSQKELRYREALVLTRLGRFEESLGVYDSMAKAGETGSEMNIGVGLAGLRIAQFPSDIPGNQQDLYADAGSATLRYLEGDQAGAQEAFDNLFARFPTVPNAHYLYGFLMHSADPDAAIAQYKRELEIAPNNVTASTFLAWMLELQNQPAEALPYAEKTAAEAPASPIAQLVLGRSLADTGDLKQGIEHLESALRIQPGYLETHVALAKAYSEAGRSQDARRERLLSLRMATEHAVANR